MQNNTIKIEGNGNIVIQDSNNSCITINANDTDVFEKIQQLSNEQIAALQQIINEQADGFSELFKTLINGVASQKNVVLGSITATTVRIGDDKHYHYTTKKLCKELTAKIPCLDADKIIGRTTELDELHQMLHSNKQVVVMNGLGGIGKTTLAQVYARKYWDDYKHIAWITQTTDDIQLDFANEQALFNNLAIGNEFTDANAIFNEVVRKLKAVEEQPNLLIIDNADASLEKLRDKLPHQPQWHILITSRQELNGFTLKRLDFLSPKDALKLFKTYYTRNELSDEQIESLIKAVEYHTLTIEILAKTAENYEYNFEELFNAIKLDLDTEIGDINHSENTIYRIGSYLSSIFKLNKLDTEEIWLIKQIACLPSEYITYDIIKELILEDKNNKKLHLILNKLAKKSWLLKNTEADSFKMHRIIKEVVKQQQITIEECSYLFEMITGKLNVDYTKDNPIEIFQWVPFGNELLAIFEIQQTFTRDDENKITRLQNNMALVLQDLSDYNGAKKLLEKAMMSAEKNFGVEHPLTATIYSNLATVIQNFGDYKGAKKLLEKAIISDEKNFGIEHPNLVITYSNLATVLQDLGDYEEAKVLLGKVVISTEKNLGKEHPFTTTTYSNLAMVLQDLGDYKSAKKLLEKAVKNDEKNFGTEHPDTALRYSNLAIALQNLGDYEGAKKLLEKAMIIDEKNYGTEHPSTALKYSNLATVLLNLGDYKGAKILLEKAAKSDKKNFGVDHPSTARTYSNLAMVLQNLGDYEGAKILLEKAMMFNEKSFGVELPITAITYSNLAIVLQNLGDYERALELSDKAVAVIQNALPAGHPTIIKLKKNNEGIKQIIKYQKK